MKPRYTVSGRAFGHLPVVARDQFDLAEVLGLHRSEGALFDVHDKLLQKIIDVMVKKKNMTVLQISKKSGVSRTDVKQIAQGYAVDVSIDAMLRILWALGVSVDFRFGRTKTARKTKMVG